MDRSFLISRIQGKEMGKTSKKILKNGILSSLIIFGIIFASNEIINTSALEGTFTLTGSANLLTPSPIILSLVADDPKIVTVLGYDDGDTITVTFDKSTNRPPVSTKSNLDALFNETPTLGNDYTGSWLSTSVLEITIIDAATTAPPPGFTLSLKASGNLKDEPGTSPASTAVSPALTGNFGLKAGPFITSYEADDPSNDVGFDAGDRLIVRFSEDTNTPNVATTGALNTLFDFSPAIGNEYTGVFTNPKNLVITITDASGTAPIIGSHTITVQGAGNLQAIDGSQISTATSPPLAGTFGRPPGPGFVSIVAGDPDGSDAIVSSGDTIIITFDTATNQPFGPSLNQANLDALFTFTQILTTNPNGITGLWVDDVTLVITILDPTGNTLTTGPGGLRLNVNESANLKDVSGNSLASTASSPALIGNFGQKAGPSFLTVQAGDPDGTITGEASGLTDGDTIIATFDQSTNRPNIATKSDVDKVFGFENIGGASISIGTNYVGTWITKSVAQITILDTSGATSQEPPDLILRVKSSGNLKDEPGTSFASTSISNQITDDFGALPPPAITDLIAADPSNDDAVFDDGDTILVRFNKDTSLAAPSSLNNDQLDDLFVFSQEIGDNPTAQVLNKRTILITVDQTEFLPAPPKIGELQLTVKASANLMSDDGSAASTAVSPVLSGTFGNAAGPGILSIVADDPDGADAVYSNGDTITVTFDEATNQPDVATKTDLDTLFEFSPELTTSPNGIIGSWIDDVTLVITIENANVPAPLIDDDGVDDGELRITAKGTGTTTSTQILNKAETSLPSTAVSPLLTGNFGTKAGPQIISLVAGDPTNVFGYTAGDTITVTFDEGTNRPTAATKTDLDTIFDFGGIGLGADYVGSWTSSNILVITIIDTTLATPPVVGSFSLDVKAGANLKNEAGTSLASTSSSPILSGNFGLEAGPEIESITAADPSNNDAIFDEGDTITIRFDKDTDLAALTSLTREQLDSFFIFSQAIGDSYSAFIPNTRTVIITIDDADFLPEPPVIGELIITVRDGQIKAANPASSFSTSVSPPLEGTFGTAPGPAIVELVARDPFGTDAIFGDDDTITVLFDVPTNEKFGPDLTESEVDALLTFSLPLTSSDYTATWFDSQTLIISFGTAGTEVPVIGGFNVEVNEAAQLQNEDETSLSSISASPQLSGDFGQKAGPSIVSIVADDPKNNPEVGLDEGDTITVSFNEATNQPPVSNKSELDDLFVFSQIIGTDYTGIWFDPLTLVIIIEDKGGNDATVGSLTLTVKDDGTDDLNNAANTSLDSTSTSPVLEGNFGQKAGPTILSLIADDPKDTPVPGFDNGDTITVIWSEKTDLVNPFTRAELDSFFTFSQIIGDDYTGALTATGDLVITIVDGEQLTEPPVIDELQIVVKESANIQADGGSLPSTAVSPFLSGNFGAFIEEVSLCEGGDAFSTFPDGKTAEISFAGGDCGGFTFETADEDTSERIEFVGEPVSITPTGETDCSVPPNCTLNFVFREEQIPLEEGVPVDPFTDIKILKDVDGDQSILQDFDGNGEVTQTDLDASNEVFNGLPLNGITAGGGTFDTPDTTVVALDDVRFQATATTPSNSKFAIGGIKALAVGALAPSISSTPSAPSAAAPGAGAGAGGGGGGNAGSLGEEGGFAGSIDLTQVKLFEATWDKCDEKILQVIAGPPGEGLSVKAVAAQGGIIAMQQASTQPYLRATVYETPISELETFIRVQVEGVIGREASLAQRSLDLRECTGSIGGYSEAEEFTQPESTVPLGAFPSAATLFEDGSMFDTNYNSLDFSVSYRIPNGEISQMNVNEDDKAVTFILSEEIEGRFTLSLPRGLIDANNDRFIFVDDKTDESIDYEVLESGVQYVTLELKLPDGTDSVTVIGTAVVPEFGTIAMLVLVVATVSIIIISRTRQIQLPRF